MAMISASFIFDILRMLATADAPLSVTEIGQRLKIPLTTVYRGMTTLEEAGYAERHQGSNLFMLGHMGRPLVQRFLARFKLRDLAFPFLRQLTTLTGDTAALFVRIGWYHVRIAHVHGTNEIIQTRPLGEVRDLDDGAAGRIILAYMPEELQARYFSEFKPLLPSIERRRLRQALEQIRLAGLAVESSPTAADRLAVAFPIVSPSGTIFGSINIEGGVLSESRQPDEVEPLLAIVRKLVDLCSASPDKFHNPYDHLSPSSILLPSVTDQDGKSAAGRHDQRAKGAYI